MTFPLFASIVKLNHKKNGDEMTQQIPEQDRVNPKNQSRQTDGRERRGCLEERERPERPERRGRKPDRRRDLYLRIAADIDAGILSGKLPGVLKLAQRYQACHGTVQNAIRLLADAGYILVRPRSGCYVRRRLEVVMAGLYPIGRAPCRGRG